MKKSGSNSNLPTSMELATLAARLNPLAKNLSDQENSVSLAFSLWQIAHNYLALRDRAAEQRKTILAGIFSMDEAEWKAWIENYSGPADELSNAISSARWPAAEVHKRLFQDRSLTNRQRERFFLNLADFAMNHQIEYMGHLMDEDKIHVLRHSLKKPEIDGHTCRWAFETRKRQIALAKSRP